jgi:hypothetical protein
MFPIFLSLTIICMSIIRKWKFFSW